MIYSTSSPYFASFLGSGKHKPTSEEVITALKDIKEKVRTTLDPPRVSRHITVPPPSQNPELSPEDMAATLRDKRGSSATEPCFSGADSHGRTFPGRGAFRYRQWILEGLNWSELSRMMGDDD